MSTYGKKRYKNTTHPPIITRIVLAFFLQEMF